MSVYLTVVFSNKMMKGLLIVLSVSERLSVFVFTSSDSETAGAVACSTPHNAAHSQRDTQNKQIIFLYSSVFAL